MKVVSWLITHSFSSQELFACETRMGTKSIMSSQEFSERRDLSLQYWQVLLGALLEETAFSNTIKRIEITLTCS